MYMHTHGYTIPTRWPTHSPTRPLAVWGVPPGPLKASLGPCRPPLGPYGPGPCGHPWAVVPLPKMVTKRPRLP